MPVSGFGGAGNRRAGKPALSARALLLWVIQIMSDPVTSLKLFFQRQENSLTRSILLISLIYIHRSLLVKLKQAGTCGRSMKHHLRWQISIYVQFSSWCKVILHVTLKVNKLNMFNSIFLLVQISDLTYVHFLCPAHKCQLVLVLLY